MAEAQPAPTTVLFARGVIAILNTWPVLRLAVEQAWGGPESAAKRRWLAGAIVDAFESTPSPDAQYIEEMLLQVLQDEFEVEVDDESGADIAKQIVQLWAQTGDTAVQQLQAAVDALEATEQRAKSKKVIAQQAAGASDEEWDDTDDESDDDKNDGRDEPPQLVDRSGAHQREEPEVDDDGFTVVKRGNRSAR